MSDGGAAAHVRPAAVNAQTATLGLFQGTRFIANVGSSGPGFSLDKALDGCSMSADVIESDGDKSAGTPSPRPCVLRILTWSGPFATWLFNRQRGDPIREDFTLVSFDANRNRLAAVRAFTTTLAAVSVGPFDAASTSTPVPITITLKAFRYHGVDPRGLRCPHHRRRH